MAAPVAFVGSEKYGVSVGMSLVELPSAPGAPSGQSGMEVCISARDKIRDENKTAAAKNFFIFQNHFFFLKYRYVATVEISMMAAAMGWAWGAPSAGQSLKFIP